MLSQLFKKKPQPSTTVAAANSQVFSNLQQKAPNNPFLPPQSVRSTRQTYGSGEISDTEVGAGFFKNEPNNFERFGKGKEGGGGGNDHQTYDFKQSITTVITKYTDDETRQDSQIVLYTNKYGIGISKELRVVKFGIAIAPEVPVDSAIFDQIFQRKNLVSYFSQILSANYIRVRNYIYVESLQRQNTHMQSHRIQLRHDSQDYQIELEPIKQLDCQSTDREFCQIIKLAFTKSISEIKQLRRMVRRRNQVFDPDNLIDLSAHNFHMWPGFQYDIVAARKYQNSLGQKMNSSTHFSCMFLLNLRSIFQIIRMETVLEKLVDIREMCFEKNINYLEEVQKSLYNQPLITYYNNKSYLFHQIHLQMTPESRFDLLTNNQGGDSTMADRFQVSFYDYFTKRYNVTIVQTKQPMISARVQQKRASRTSSGGSGGAEQDLDGDTDEIVFLVPELCHIVGPNELILNRKASQKEIKKVVRVDAPVMIQRLDIFRELITEGCENAKKVIESWGIQVEQRPQKVLGYKLDPGYIIMGQKSLSLTAQQKQEQEFTIQKDLDEEFEDRVAHNIELKGTDIGIDLQSFKLFDQKSIEKWGVFYQEKDNLHAKNFVAMMEKVLLQHDYQAKPMAMFPVPGNNIDIWQEEIKSKMLKRGSSSVQVIILLIPGRNGRSQLYRELKRLTLQEIPIVSQMVLTGTIRYGKNLNSLTTKILIQICAKIGGVPWIIDRMPLFNHRIMICGMDAFHDTKNKCKSVIGFVASYNRTATKFWSKSVTQQRMGQETCMNLKELMMQALSNFRQINGTFPDRVIFYRDGISHGGLRSVTQAEISQILQAFKLIDQHLNGIGNNNSHQIIEKNSESLSEIKLIYLTVNRRTKTELYSQGIYEEDSYKNCVAGTVFEQISPEEKVDKQPRSLPCFYLISQTQKLGMQKPTKYTIHYDSVGNQLSDVELLTYKLCHLYFNVMGPIKVPAPVLYARKLCNLVAEKNELELETGPEKEPIRISESFTSYNQNQNGAPLYFI